MIISSCPIREFALHNKIKGIHPLAAAEEKVIKSGQDSSHPLEWLLSKQVFEYIKKLEHLCIAGGNVKGAVAVENSLEVLQKLEIKLPYDPRIPVWHISQ